jgi:hypothetical protein
MIGQCLENICEIWSAISLDKNETLLQGNVDIYYILERILLYMFLS